MEATGKIKYPGQTKTSTAALRVTEGSVKARGRKPWKKITWSSSLGVMRRASYLSMENICKLDSQRRNGTRRFNGCRRKWVQRNMSNKLCIETWNVKTLLKPGKMQELAEELAKTQLEIVAIQETRWSRTGLIKKNIFHYTTVELKIK